MGDYHSLQEIMEDHKPDIVIMADLDPMMGEIIALANLCVRENVQFKVIPSYFQTLSSGLHLEHVSGVPVLGVSKLPLDHMFNRIVKRTVDVVGAVVGLILSAPIIALFGYLIRRESPGPIFYTQARSGMGGKSFNIYKLRSMKLDADAKGARFAVANDPRCLKIGAFMRKWNVDEVPPILERAHRRHEPGRAAPGTDRECEDPQGRDHPLQCTPLRPSRRHRLRPGERPPRQHRPDRPAQIRSLLPRELERLPRFLHHGPHVPEAEERLLSEETPRVPAAGTPKSIAAPLAPVAKAQASLVRKPPSRTAVELRGYDAIAREMAPTSPPHRHCSVPQRSPHRTAPPNQRCAEHDLPLENSLGKKIYVKTYVRLNKDDFLWRLLPQNRALSSKIILYLSPILPDDFK